MEKQIIATLENFIKQATDIPQDIGILSQDYEDYVREENPKTKKDKFEVLYNYILDLKGSGALPPHLLSYSEFQVGTFNFKCNIFSAIDLLKNSHKFKAASSKHREISKRAKDYRGLRLQNSVNELRDKYDGESMDLFKSKNNHLASSDMIDECWRYISNK